MQRERTDSGRRTHVVYLALSLVEVGLERAGAAATNWVVKGGYKPVERRLGRASGLDCLKRSVEGIHRGRGGSCDQEGGRATARGSPGRESAGMRPAVVSLPARLASATPLPTRTSKTDAYDCLPCPFPCR